jgi:hypothetical protein
MCYTGLTVNCLRLSWLGCLRLRIDLFLFQLLESSYLPICVNFSPSLGERALQLTDLFELSSTSPA